MIINQQTMREKTKMTYEFRNLKTIENRKFEATDLIAALNLVSKAWFDSTKVTDFMRSGNQITLLSNHPSGNTIGKVYLFD